MKLVNVHKPCLVLLLIVIGFQSAQAQVWSLQQCIDTAQVYNKKLQVNRNDIAIGEQREKEAKAKRELKTLEEQLDQLTLQQFGQLTADEVKTLVVDDKWLTTIKASIQTEIDAISQRLTGRVKELAERYATTLVALNQSTQTQEEKVLQHLQKMGLVWKS